MERKQDPKFNCLTPSQGSHLECQYELMRYGIPQSILPIDSSGDFRGVKFAACFEERYVVDRGEQQDVKAKLNVESKTPQAGMIAGNVVVRENDVLLGSGISTSHPGNTRLLEILQRKRTTFDKASKFEKTCISIAIVAMIKESKGRFLKRRAKGLNEWVEADDLEARKSVICRFRNAVLTPY